MCTRTWKEDRGRQREEVERGRKRMEVESDCFKVCEGEKETCIQGIESVFVTVWEEERRRHRGGI